MMSEEHKQSIHPPPSASSSSSTTQQGRASNWNDRQLPISAHERERMKLEGSSINSVDPSGFALSTVIDSDSSEDEMDENEPAAEESTAAPLNDESDEGPIQLDRHARQKEFEAIARWSHAPESDIGAGRIQPPKEFIQQQQLSQSLSNSSTQMDTSSTDPQRTRTDVSRKRSRLESESDSTPQPIRNASSASAAAANRPTVSRTATSTSSPAGITALLPATTDDSASSSSLTYDPSIFGCRKVTCYSRLNTIDEGTYGVVHRAVDIATGEQVALKKIKLDANICASGFPITSLREINILLSLRHPNIVRLKEIVTSGAGRRSQPKGIYMVMEYCEHDLKALLNRMTPSTHPESGLISPAAFKPFRIPEIKSLLKQLLEGMAYLHHNWILHRDLKTSNLLYSNQGVLKICDFGLARRYGDPLRPYTPLVVTLWYRAPELLWGTKTYSSAIDMWSVGVIFAELLRGGKPLFQAQTEIEQISQIIKVLGTPSLEEYPEFADTDYGQKYSFTKHIPNTLRDLFPQQSYTGGNILTDSGFHLLSQLLCYNPSTRLTAKEALAHPYFSELPLPQSPELMPTFPNSNDHQHGTHDTQGPTSGDLKRMREQQETTTGFYL